MLSKPVDLPGIFAVHTVFTNRGTSREIVSLDKNAVRKYLSDRNARIPEREWWLGQALFSFANGLGIGLAEISKKLMCWRFGCDLDTSL